MENDKQNIKDLEFNLNGKDYKFSDLTKDQQEIVLQLHDIEDQLSHVEFKHRQLVGAKTHFTSDLSTLLAEATMPNAEAENIDISQPPPVEAPDVE